jgi:hypothetical protein
MGPWGFPDEMTSRGVTFAMHDKAGMNKVEPEKFLWIAIVPLFPVCRVSVY